ncbi:LCP family protein [Schaalia meyeri]|uniref:LCP family protein n=1 Tax=Schaalia meyeri TaxID=52773 RepID=A0AAP9Y5Q4_9ACTO|nr:LCP family protein [Schaalia meyeri]OFQ24812.1 transcriptional regulator [Actinomyces sp. HMSC062G12]QQC43199.1 LCP family protein [Schaalia meyeri]SDS06025.1 cell envelope-related function transcriptional attenuator common domain-containing protein [Schaalia meyeri]
MSNVNLRPIQHSAINYGRFGLVRSALAILMTGVLFVVSTAGFVYAKLSSQFAERVVDINAYTTDEQNKATPDSFDGRAVNILVVGTDSRSGASGDVGAGDQDDVPGVRNDSTMVIHISADRSRVQIVSIPRDTLVDIPACKHRDGSSSAPLSNEMFNNAMFYGADGGNSEEDIVPGIACVKSTVENMSGMTVDAFMVVNFAGFIDMIDALGGIWFNIPHRVEDEEAQLYVDAGCYKLDGTNSLAYMRSRKGQGDGSDISRIGRQQQLISAMVRELQSKNYVTDPGALISFLQAAIKAVKVSSNLGDASSDATLLVNVLSKVNRANIQFVTMPVKEPSWDPNRRIASEPMARNVWNALKNDQALPVGTTYTDGNGAQLVVPDPNADSAQSSGDSSGQDTNPSTPGSGEGSTDNTEQSVSVDNNAANEAAAQQTVASCPPKDK